MEEDVVISTDLELIEDVLGVVLSDVGDRPVSTAEEVVVSSAEFRVPTRTRNSFGESANSLLHFGENQRAHEVSERINVAAIEECWLKRRESLFEPRRGMGNTEHRTKISLHPEPPFDFAAYCSLTSQRA